MTTDRLIAKVQILDAPELLAVVRARVAELDVPLDQLESFMGLTPGLLGKILGAGEVRRIGFASVWKVLEALGLRMVVEEHLDRAATLDEMAARTRPRQRKGPPRGKLRMALSEAVIKASAARMGAKGGSSPKRFRISREKHSQINRRNARKRWKHVKATEQHVGRPG